MYRTGLNPCADEPKRHHHSGLANHRPGERSGSQEARAHRNAQGSRGLRRFPDSSARALPRDESHPRQAGATGLQPPRCAPKRRHGPTRVGDTATAASTRQGKEVRPSDAGPNPAATGNPRHAIGNQPRQCNLRGLEFPIPSGKERRRNRWDLSPAGSVGHSENSKRSALVPCRAGGRVSCRAGGRFSCRAGGRGIGCVQAEAAFCHVPAGLGHGGSGGQRLARSCVPARGRRGSAAKGVAVADGVAVANRRDRSRQADHSR